MKIINKNGKEIELALKEYVDEMNKKSHCMLTANVGRSYTYVSSAILTAFDTAMNINDGLAKMNNYIRAKKDMNLVSFKVYIRFDGNTNVYIRHTRGTSTVKEHIVTAYGSLGSFFDVCFGDVKAGDDFHIRTYTYNTTRTVFSGTYISLTEV